MLIVRLMNAHPSIPNRHAGVNAYVRCGQAALFPALAQDTACKHGKHLRILNGDFEPALGAASVPEAPKGLENSGYVRQILEKQREDLLGKLREIDRALEQMK